jgi:hypothetical protein
MPIAHTPARIGQLWFKYSDPNVSVTTEAQTIEHDTIDESIVIQQIGRRADSITVEGTVAESSLDIIDDLVTHDVVSLRTGRWSGDVTVTSTSTSPRNAIDDDGEWLYEATIECLETDKAAQPTVDANFEDAFGGDLADIFGI